MTKHERIEYVKGIMQNNPIERMFPITHKNNSGIDLLYWLYACRELSLDVRIQWYKHHVASATHSYDYNAQQLVLV